MNPDKKVSIITVVYNNVNHIENALKSVFAQSYKNIEYILIDGGSTDGTVEIIKKYSEKITIFISEPDNGIYNALNKGISLSTGDIIGILHSDDIFFNEHSILNSVIAMTPDYEVCFSDMAVVKNGVIMRNYTSRYFRPWLLRTGWMPAHPTLLIRRKTLENLNFYSETYKIAGDFDLFVRMFLIRETSWIYLNQLSIIMNYGGKSNSGIHSKVIISKEIDVILKQNNIFYFRFFQLARYLIRLSEFLIKPNKKTRRFIFEKCKQKKL